MFFERSFSWIAQNSRAFEHYLKNPNGSSEGWKSGGPSKHFLEPFFLTTEVSEIIKFKEPKPWDDSRCVQEL